MQVIPTEDEVSLLSRYEGPPSELSAPEQFLATMAQVPRLRNKIQVSTHTGQRRRTETDQSLLLCPASRRLFSARTFGV